MKHKNIRIVLVSLSTVLTGTAALAQSGPGGVDAIGTATGLKLWLSAHRGAYTNAGTTLATNGQSVQQWSDFSGNALNATNTAATKPVFSTAGPNGFPTLQFSAQTLAAPINISPGVTPAVTIVSVAMPTVVSTAVAKLWGHDDGGYDRCIGFDGRGATLPFVYFHGTNAADYANPTVNTYFISTASYTTSLFNGYFNGVQMVTNAAVSNGSGLTNLSIGSINPTTEFWNGNITEFILFNRTLSDGERIIAENYLAAKYGLPLAGNDIYTMDNPGNGNYDYEVAGIGQGATGAAVTSARGSGILQVSGASAMAANRYFIFGHDNGALTMTGPNRPAGYNSRLARIWRASKSGTSLGTTTLAFDVSGISGAPSAASDFALAIDQNNNGLFSDETVSGTGVIINPTRVGNTVTFSNVNIADAQRFTLVFTNTVALPLNLLSFTAGPATTGNEISWQTSEVKGVSGIELERSEDGSGFRLLNRFSVNESGTYATTDAYPTAISYYRLRILNRDGTAGYSAIRKVSRTESNKLQISPNPVSDIARISGLPGTEATIRLLDAAGRVLITARTAAPGYQLSLRGYPAGNYLIDIDAEDFHQIEQIVKQ